MALTPLQHSLLRCIQRGQLGVAKNYNMATLDSLFRRNLIRRGVDGRAELTDYGRHALEHQKVYQPQNKEVARAKRIARKRQRDKELYDRIFYGKPDRRIKKLYTIENILKDKI